MSILGKLRAHSLPASVRILLVFVTLGAITGCTATQISTVIKDIGIYAQEAEPLIIALVPVLTAFSATSGDTQTSASLNTFAQVATGDLKALSSLCGDYLASPNATAYGEIQNVVDKLVNESDGALLQVLAIKDPATRERLQLAMAGFDAIIHTIDGFMQTTESATTVAAKAQARAVKLRQVATAWNEHDRSNAAHTFGTTFDSLLRYESHLGF